MMYAPFIEDSDDMLSQLAQLQIFLTLLSSLALRATPPSETVGNMVTALLFIVPLIGVALETPLLDELSVMYANLKAAFNRLFPKCQPPPLFTLKPDDEAEPQAEGLESVKELNMAAAVALPSSEPSSASKKDQLSQVL